MPAGRVATVDERDVHIRVIDQRVREGHAHRARAHDEVVGLRRSHRPCPPAPNGAKPSGARHDGVHRDSPLSPTADRGYAPRAARRWPPWAISIEHQSDESAIATAKVENPFDVGRQRLDQFSLAGCPRGKSPDASDVLLDLVVVLPRGTHHEILHHVHDMGADGCSRSTAIRPSTGSTCAPRIRSSRPSRPSGCGNASPAGVHSTHAISLRGGVQVTSRRRPSSAASRATRSRLRSAHRPETRSSRRLRTARCSASGPTLAHTDTPRRT